MDGGTGDIASDGYHKYKVSLNGEKFKGQFDLLQSFSSYRLEIPFHLHSLHFLCSKMSS